MEMVLWYVIIGLVFFMIIMKNTVGILKRDYPNGFDNFEKIGAALGVTLVVLTWPVYIMIGIVGFIRGL